MKKLLAVLGVVGVSVLVVGCPSFPSACDYGGCLDADGSTSETGPGPDVSIPDAGPDSNVPNPPGCAALVGYQRERVAALLAHNINLYAYHLPLDVHAEVGNNACLGRRLGLSPTGTCGEAGLVMLGQLGVSADVRCTVLAAYVARHYGRRVTLFSHPERPIRTIAWCTGAGGSLLGDAIAAGADAFITGEISEQHVHQARESNITLIAAGHHATERDGVAALAAHLVQQFGVNYQFIDINSPV